ncbi:MAG: copper homeostasis protein CutC, partial [Paenibacillus sp.]|nr:copper homeostasis protein CutC [Paenibacillus sp.]
MIIEVIAIRAEDIVAAAEGGADRIELVSGIAEGGLTPSAGLVEAAVRASALPVNVMIRPHSQSFVYSESDLRIMLRDIECAREAGAAGIVVGLLDRSGRICEKGLEPLLKAAEGLDVTFHRAFDEIGDQLEALRTLSRYPMIRRVLTAGGRSPAPEAADWLRELRLAANGMKGPAIMGGYGLKPSNIHAFVDRTGVAEIHFGSGVRKDN